MSTKTSTNKTKLKREQLWYELEVYQHDMAQQRMSDLFAADPQRFERFHIDAAKLALDFSKNIITEDGLKLLIELAETSGLKEAIEALFSGQEVNNTEHRPAMHAALRNGGQGLAAEEQQTVQQTYCQMEAIVNRLHNQQWLGSNGEPIRDVVNIGIGGSDLGPVMANLALTPYAKGAVRIHYVSNIDGTHLSERLKHLNPETTLFIVASKSFNTIETKMNALAARAWCINHGILQEELQHHFIAVSTNIEAAVEFGIAKENILPMWDWVGGRYSLWSAIGLPIAINIGMQGFKRLLNGAAQMDLHFKQADFRHNMPVILALLSIWYINFFKSETEIVIPYDHYLHKFPAYLQQLEMESNGKSVHKDGSPVKYHTMGAIFGESGSNTQHSFHQLLHQGTHLFPVDFIVPAKSHNPLGDQHDYLFANCLSQSRALMVGRSYEEVVEEMREQGYSEAQIEELAHHKVVPGNKPSNTIMMQQLTPEALGALIALYEHKVYVESVIWDIDAFDQWGVELGKVLSNDIVKAIQEQPTVDVDPSTRGLIRLYQHYNSH
jgi:glucose-6-phosphate isomerase